MNKLIIMTAAAALMLGVSGPAIAATAEDCQSMFQKADINKDASLQADESKVFLDAMNQAQMTPKDANVVTQDEFMAACQKDAFAKIDPATIGQSTAATTEQPAATTDQTATTTTEQPAATTDQTATTTTEQPAAETTTTDQTSTTTTDQTATTTTTDQSAQQPAEQEQALAAPEAFMASDLIGATIYSASDENLGELKDLIISPDGQPTHAIVDVGDKDVAIELAQLKVAATQDGLKIMTSASKADLEGMPAVTTQKQ
jgi:hypothetical protein